MTLLILCAVLSGVFTLLVIAPIAHSRPRTCYLLMLLIPASSVGIYMMLNPPAPLPSKEPPIIASEDLNTIKKTEEIEEEHLLLQQIEKDKTDITAISKLAGLYITQEKYDQAINLLTNTFEGDKKHQDIALQLATAYFAKGLLFAEHEEHEKALKTLQTAHDLSPEDAPFLPDLEHFIKIMENLVSMNKEE